MDSFRFEYIKESLAAFDFSLLQDAVNIFRKLFDNDIGLEEFFEYVSESGRAMTANSAMMLIEQKMMQKYCVCPKCGHSLLIEPLNHSPRASLEGDDSRLLSMATCSDESGCGWQEFSYQPVEVYLRSFFPDEVVEYLSKKVNIPHGQ